LYRPAPRDPWLFPEELAHAEVGRVDERGEQSHRRDGDGEPRSAAGTARPRAPLRGVEIRCGARLDASNERGLALAGLAGGDVFGDPPTIVWILRPIPDGVGHDLFWTGMSGRRLVALGESSAKNLVRVLEAAAIGTLREVRLEGSARGLVELAEMQLVEVFDGFFVRHRSPTGGDLSPVWDAC
jgi:hypothetical protein